MPIKKNQLDRNQDTDDQGNIYGYIHGDDGGFFFTRHDDLDATLASIEADEADGDGGLSREAVAEFLASELAC